ncbi:Protein kinase domain [Macleaya cordata]|uniref:non-specific serine/threonine protein kinase n=1 Tax=Macleaya cordata TaxID=56857 RepID=A0A200RBN6_MACCD|nr:Protein kinase domain [Macleaya cordata]
MNSPPRKLLPFFFFSLSFIFFGFPSFPFTTAQNLTFDFPSFTLRNITLLGHSYLRNGVLGLTQELGVPASSSGSVIFNSPITFFDPKTNVSASFSTRFSFSITNINAGSYGDGLTFFISPDNQTLGSPGGYLGLVNSSQLTKNKFIAVEFDTRLDSLFDDPNDNHIGLDIESLNSVRTEDVASRGIDLRSGNLITAWINYTNDQKILKVWLSYSSSKPEKPILSMKIDLSIYFKELMYVGFSASTEGSTELHLIADWTFQTFGFYPVKQWSKPHNVSDSSIPVLPVIPVSDSSNNIRKKLGLGFGIAGPSFFCIAFVIFGWISIKKCKKNRTAESFKPELLQSPRQFQYIDLKSATKGFHSSRIVGHGSFGTVYKAIFPCSGTTFAVKRTKETHEGKTEFLAELSIIACLRHKNLVQLQGWCTENGELLLVYEFMSNGSLDKVLYQEPNEGILLNWPQRYNIAVGIASVLTYLHEECEQQVIHRDIKTSNIMLDQNFNPSCANPSSTERPSMRRVLQILNDEAELSVIPKMKPSLTFSSSLPLSLDDIVSECEKSGTSSPSYVISIS